MLKAPRPAVVAKSVKDMLKKFSFWQKRDIGVFTYIWDRSKFDLSRWVIPSVPVVKLKIVLFNFEGPIENKQSIQDI